MSISLTYMIEKERRKRRKKRKKRKKKEKKEIKKREVSKGGRLR